MPNSPDTCVVPYTTGRIPKAKQTDAPFETGIFRVSDRTAKRVSIRTFGNTRKVDPVGKVSPVFQSGVSFQLAMPLSVYRKLEAYATDRKLEAYATDRKLEAYATDRKLEAYATKTSWLRCPH